MKIDVEFQSLIPPLTYEEKKMLEESILSEGCRDAIVVWNDTIIDGHNRYEICTKHGIPFETVSREFENRNEVIEWIIKNQFGRRNLPMHERARLALRLKPVIAEKAKEKQAEYHGNQYTSGLSQNSVEVQPLAEFCQTLCRNLHGVRVSRILTTRRTVRNKGGSVLPKTGRNPIKGYTDKPL